MIYSVTEIIGKNLIAAAPVTIKRSPFDSAGSVYTVPTGQSVGVVYSYLMPKENRSVLYWVFKDSTGREYYAPHQQGLYSLTALKDQGTLTVKEQTEIKQEQSESLQTFLSKNIKIIVLIIAGAIVLKSVLPEIIKSRK